MTAIGVSVLFFCVLFFLFRKMIFSYCGAVIYKIVQKSVASSAGKISTAAVEQRNEENNLFFFGQNNVECRNGFLINVRMIGQNFDLNARENIKYSTPSPLQDLKEKNGLA